MRALLIVNPYATTTTAAGRDALAHTLGAHIELTVEETTHRGHAGELAAAARERGFGAVIVHGGDGTVNEAVNGLLGPVPEDVDSADYVPANDIPAIGVVPGGSANVFARSLGIDPDPLRATKQLVELLTAQQFRRIGLGHTDDRWFLFNAGMGVDASVVHRMERARTGGTTATDARYLAATVRCFLAEARRAPRLTVWAGDHPMTTSVYFAFVSNSTPWTFLGNRRIEVNPHTHFDGHLGVFASRSMRVTQNLRLIAQLLTNRDPHAQFLLRDDDVTSVRIVSCEPIDTQIDGDYFGRREQMTFGVTPGALKVVSPRA